MDAAETPSLSKKQIAAVAAGNALEFYDFLTYTFFAAQIGEALFPGSGEAQLLLSLATFGVGFITRPLGGFVIGRFADRRGRKPAMILSFALMGFAIVGLALTPSYAMIGMGAPILAVLLRMILGLCSWRRSRPEYGLPRGSGAPKPARILCLAPVCDAELLHPDRRRRGVAALVDFDRSRTRQLGLARCLPRRGTHNPVHNRDPADPRRDFLQPRRARF